MSRSHASKTAAVRVRASGLADALVCGGRPQVQQGCDVLDGPDLIGQVRERHSVP
jgi:hypothetical protein